MLKDTYLGDVNATTPEDNPLITVSGGNNSAVHGGQGSSDGKADEESCGCELHDYDNEWSSRWWMRLSGVKESGE